MIQQRHVPRAILRACFLLACTLAVPAGLLAPDAAEAQAQAGAAETAVISGTVTDPSGRPLADVSALATLQGDGGSGVEDITEVDGVTGWNSRWAQARATLRWSSTRFPPTGRTC